MAAAKTKQQQQVGSVQWIQSEREQAHQLVNQEVEEFSYSARNELEWLNEHMAEIFTRDQFNFTEVFKTPGKLRGKTPKTARKQDPQVARAPLTDLFAPNPQALTSPAQRTPFYNKVAKFKIAEDGVDQHRPQSASRRSPLRVGKENTDSGYHGMTEDEMEIEHQSFNIPSAIVEQSNAETEAKPFAKDDSFVSANEDLENEVREDLPEDDDAATVADPDMDVEVDDNTHVEQAASLPVANPQSEILVHEDEEAGTENLEQSNDGAAINGSSPPSEGSSPEKPLLRKSSLNFASLPPRETLTAKRSLGPRNSHLDAHNGRNSVLVRSVRQKSIGDMEQDGDEDEEEDDNELDQEIGGSARTTEHNKTSTQRLHERINMLGQSKEPKASQTVAAPIANLQASYPRLPRNLETNEILPGLDPADGEQGDDDEDNDDDDDWIAPIENISRPTSTGTLNDTQAPLQNVRKDDSQLPTPSRPRYGHQKSISTTNIASPTKSTLAPDVLRQKAMSVSNPNLSHAMGQVHTSTPTGSPNARKFPDGPLSASKSKLYSVLKSARGIFASSAGASAQAKVEALSSPAARLDKTAAMFESDSLMYKMPGGFQSDVTLAPRAAERPVPVVAEPIKEGRKTRSSTESEKKRDKDAKESKRAMDDLERVREKERKKAAEQKQERERIEREQVARFEQEKAEALGRTNSQRSAVEKPIDEEHTSADEMPPPAAPKSMLPAGKLRAPGRLGKPTRQAAQPARPAPMNIRVASQSQRLGSVQPSGSVPPPPAHEPTPPPAMTRQQAARAGSVPVSGKAAAPVPNARVKALEAAARRKEQEEKAAQRKAEQKRELERKRTAKAEEDRRLEQERKAAEQQRIQDAKVAAQKQAEQRRLEQQRREAAAQKAKAEAEFAAVLEYERAQAPSAHPRGDVQGTLRQLGKTATVVESSNNQSKLGKRPMQQDTEEEPQQRPAMQRNPASYQQQEAKRRRTNDEEDTEMRERHSVMAPPKRPSNMRKETLTKFPHGYAHAPPPAAHHAQNMYKATVAAQHQLQHAAKPPPMHPNDMLKLSTARIPFAENVNPSQMQQHHQQQPMAHPNNTFKTPARPQNGIPLKSTKSSPAYPNGENIALPEINTDSEDDDSEDDEATGGFRAPSWVASPALRDLLTQQQLVDPESVFGPIAPLQMDEVFKNGKNAERLKRFRDRGSSARWVESGDAVTSAEKKRDREARARVVRDGGWSFQKDL